ncbi:DUF1304 domain-containing protein [Olivibacter sp. SDN3]|uniref:DUF1304 domain-containing protein n=1 Tax=Olivibacter sp. SDN3 TaxID=2764720 RepID=UPI001650EB7A|nr:DUF1304 domain-containing protein [Olivibacter sp. SDN3]QNL48039.1 DUF1304 domain-containing protein [Olivibacter sp. SDN3]
MEGSFEIIAKIAIVLIALEHVYILWIEMFAWETAGKKTFRSLPDHIFKPTKGLAANQGLYNGFLAAGLIWSIFIADAQWQRNVAVFFLSCIVIAGIYGAVTASKDIFFKQGLPAAVTLVLVLFTS